MCYCMYQWLDGCLTGEQDVLVNHNSTCGSKVNNLEKIYFNRQSIGRHVVQQKDKQMVHCIFTVSYNH